MYQLTKPWTYYGQDLNIKKTHIAVIGNQTDCSSHRSVPVAPLILGAFSAKAVQRACYARRCIESLKSEYTYKGVKHELRRI